MIITKATLRSPDLVKIIKQKIFQCKIKNEPLKITWWNRYGDALEKIFDKFSRDEQIFMTREGILSHKHSLSVLQTATPEEKYEILNGRVCYTNCIPEEIFLPLQKAQYNLYDTLAGCHFAEKLYIQKIVPLADLIRSVVKYDRMYSIMHVLRELCNDYLLKFEAKHYFPDKIISTFILQNITVRCESGFLMCRALPDINPPNIIREEWIKGRIIFNPNIFKSTVYEEEI